MVLRGKNELKTQARGFARGKSWKEVLFVLCLGRERKRNKRFHFLKEVSIDLKNERGIFSFRIVTKGP